MWLGPETVTVVKTVTVHDSASEQELARTKAALQEKEGRISELEKGLSDARQNLARALAKPEAAVSRAEAASAMAEAEVTLQSLRTGGRFHGSSAASQGADLMAMSTDEFNLENYAGALYLANEAKRVASTGQARGGGQGDSGSTRDEVPFESPVALRAVGRGNVREGPGTSFRVIFVADTGAQLTAYGYRSGWLKVKDERGRSGWIIQRLAARAEPDSSAGEGPSSDP